MADGFQCQVMLCWPTDRQAINLLNSQRQPGQAPFYPSIEHSLSTCDSCSQDVWIGPQQLQLVASPFIRVKKLCLFCAGQVKRALNLDPHEVDLNPDLLHARRRTV